MGWGLVRAPLGTIDGMAIGTRSADHRPRDQSASRSDNNQVNVLVAKKILEGAGAQVATVGDGQAALEAIKQRAAQTQQRLTSS